jgi:hypothetical protein
MTQIDLGKTWFPPALPKPIANLRDALDAEQTVDAYLARPACPWQPGD